MYKKAIFSLIVFVILLLSSFLDTAKAQDFHLFDSISKGKFKFFAPADMMISGTIYFRVKNEEQLDVLLTQQQDPTSTNYRKWLTPSEFGKQFGSSPQFYQSVVDWLTLSHIKITHTWPNNLRLDFQAPATQVEKIFQVQMGVFESDGDLRYMNIQRPSLPAFFGSEVIDVRLDNFLFAQAIRRQALKDSLNVIQLGAFAIGPKDLYVAYNFNPLFADGIEGNGQTIGIIARTDFDVLDFNEFRRLFGLPSANVVKISAGGEIVRRGALEEFETSLDAELSSAAAPRANIQVVIADRNSDIDQALNYFVNQLSNTKIVSVSFGVCEKLFSPQLEDIFNNLFKQAAAQGQTVFVASGDGGTNECGDGIAPQVNALAASPFVTAVGGTSLKTQTDSNGNVVSYKEETCWPNSGGGVSSLFVLPNYQALANIRQSGRALPDVSFLADLSPGLFVVFLKFPRIAGGTSASAPIWAGILALASQLSHSDGLGYVNPRIYKLGQMQQSSSTPLRLFFNDIIQGGNATGLLTGYQAQPGYDLCTGWGSPDVNAFVRGFVSVPDSSNQVFLISPNGGEFFPQSQQVNVRWKLSSELASKVSSQDLLFSIDQGVTFFSIATNIFPDVRSFSFVPKVITSTARFKIVIHTNDNAQMFDVSDANINIGTNLRLSVADYSASLRRLIIMGEGFSKRAKLFVNGQLIDQSPKLSSNQLFFKGTQEKLKLRTGENTIVIKIGDIVSAPYKLFVAQSSN